MDRPRMLRGRLGDWRRVAAPAALAAALGVTVLLGAGSAFAQTATNTPPVALDDAATGAPNTPIVIQARANDTDADAGDTLSIISTSIPAHGTIANNGGLTLTYTSAPGFTGTDSFEYTVSDGHGGTDSATVVVAIVGATPPAVVALADQASTPPGTAVTVAVLANDTTTGSGLHVASLGTLTPATAGAVALNTNGTITFTPAAGFTGAATITYTAANAAGATATGTLTVQVTTTQPVVDNGDDEDEDDADKKDKDAKDACKDGGWVALGFRNQGQCIASVQAADREGTQARDGREDDDNDAGDDGDDDSGDSGSGESGASGSGESGASGSGDSGDAGASRGRSDESRGNGKQKGRD